jgi:hypothetical protein
MVCVPNCESFRKFVAGTWLVSVGLEDSAHPTKITRMCRVGRVFEAHRQWSS